MRLHIAAVGRLTDGPEREIYDRYVKLCAMGRSVSLGAPALIEIPESRRGSSAQRCAEEASALLRKSPSGAVLAALDVTGKQMGSEAFARWLAARRDAGTADLVLAIGGADGHGQELLEAATATVSLGPMTLPHGLARIVLAEQVYRAVTILCGHPYHRA
ncbi:MAG: 23S rRNA (pseudouridine(1915)-N(3))-methyltransferase RlmH [Hyphomicrobiales bacterium]